MLEGKINFKNKTIEIKSVEKKEIIEENFYAEPTNGATYTSICGLFQFDYIKKQDGTFFVKQTYLL